MSNYEKLLEKSNEFWANFDPEAYAKEKAELINRWCSHNGIQGIVLGVSGGIDSAVCYKLLELAKSMEGSPIKKVAPFSIPIYGSTGTTGQDDAVRLAVALVPNINVIPLSDTSHIMGNQLACDDPFVKGQLDYWLRPAMLYGQSAKLKSQGIKTVVCGTINASEKYLGFYGYHTDPCDFCPITDLVKSRVKLVAEYLGVPQEIIDAKPSGGVFTGQTDEELFGGTYEALEALMFGGLVYDFPEFVGIKAHIERNSFKFIRGLDCVEICL